MRYCRHADGRCLDGDAPCSECDTEGYPLDARRRLKRTADDMVEDVDDGQCFRVKRTKTGLERLVPVFDGCVKWKTEQGFMVMQMLLSCLGAKGEYVLWDGVTGAEMDVSTWIEQGYGATSKVPVRHSVCTEVVTSTCIASLQQGRGVGCTCNSSQANHWRHRRSDVVEIGTTRNFEVVTSEEDWVKRCDGISFYPTLRCLVCNEIVTSTCITHLQQGKGVGCTCNSTQANHWRHRRFEVVELGKARNFEVVTSKEEWVERCNGCHYCPLLRCTTCKEVVTSTCVSSLQRGKRVVCTCNSTHANHWRHRRSEVVEFGTTRSFEVVTSEEEWLENCNGCFYCPTLRCTVCKEVVTGTCIHSLQRGNGVGCTCNSTQANHWRHRRSEVVEFGTARNFEVVTSEEEWLANCNGKDYCPTLRCVVCKEVVTSTCVNSLQQGQGIGCNGCRNKTECILLKWLQTRLPSVTISTQHRGPRTTCDRYTHFDFHLAFPDGYGVLIELDGAQHFWDTLKYFSDDGCERDLLKESTDCV